MSATDTTLAESLAAAELDLHCFAAPYVPAPQALFDLVGVEHARLVCQEFLDRNAGALDQVSDGLTGTLAEWLERPAGFDDVWTLGFGRLRAALRPGREAEALLAAVHFAVSLHEAGHAGNWSARLARHAQLRFGRYELAVVGTLRVAAGDGTASLQADGPEAAAALQLTHKAAGWEGGGASRLPMLDRHGIRVILLMRRSLECASFDDLRTRTPEHMATADVLGTLTGAIDLLASATPHYARWVGRTLRSILPLAQPADGQHLSGSYVDRPGAVTCSFPAPPAMIAELLVHECSHQHFYLLRRLGSMHDEADATLYYSPVRDMGRPLLYILLAYHAVANMLLFHRDALAAGAPDAGLHAGRTADLSAWLPALQAPLMRPGALTALGRMLFEPLQARLAIQ